MKKQILILLISFLSTIGLGQIYIDTPSGLSTLVVQNNTDYYLKAGVIFNSGISIMSKDNVSFQSYGIGNKPKISDVYIYASQNITIKGLEIAGSTLNDNEGVRIQGDNNSSVRPSKFISVIDCDIHTFGQGVAYDPRETPLSNQGSDFTFKGNKIYNIGTDGMWLPEIKNLVVESNHIYNVAQIYNAGGDGIHFSEGCPNYLIKDNIIDRRGSAGKFCLIKAAFATPTGSYGRVTGNTFYPADDASLGGSGIWYGASETVEFDHNTFIGGAVSAIHCPGAYISTVTFAYNLLINVQSGSIIGADDHVYFMNNTVISPTNADYPYIFQLDAGGTCKYYNNIVACYNGEMLFSNGSWDSKNNKENYGSPNGWQTYFGFAGANDYHLTVNSICKDAGFTYTGYTYDLDGNLTPNGIRDIGCYEYGSYIPPEPIYGAMDTACINYNPLATVDDGSCIPKVYDCMDNTAINFNPLANINCCCEYPEPCDTVYVHDTIYVPTYIDRKISFVDIFTDPKLVTYKDGILYVGKSGTGSTGTTINRIGQIKEIQVITSPEKIQWFDGKMIIK